MIYKRLRSIVFNKSMVSIKKNPLRGKKIYWKTNKKKSFDI